MPIIYCDGGCLASGTVNASGYGSFRIEGERVPHRIQHGAGVCGRQTNNTAEYATLIAALEYCKEHNIKGATVCLDSALVVNQVGGRWRVKEAHLRPLCDEASALVRETGALLKWVPRAKILLELGH